jgi:siderophore synthetase component
MNTDTIIIKRILQACLQEQLLPYQTNGDRVTIILNNKRLISSFSLWKLGKFELHGEILLADENGATHALDDLPLLLSLLEQPLQALTSLQQWQCLISEITNCAHNLSMTTSFMRETNHQLNDAMKQSSMSSLLPYLMTCHDTSTLLSFFEQWAASGHPSHPCHKTKMGFTAQQYRQYSPEFNSNIPIPLIAVDQTVMHLAHSEADFDYNQWFAHHFKKQWEQYKTQLHLLGFSEDQYYPIFSHPWQMANTLPTLFEALIAAQKIILFPEITLQTKASLSFRTLISQEAPTHPHIKLPVAVTSTSAMRTVSPASVQNGPALTHIFNDILRKEHDFNHTLKIANDLCGLHIQQNNASLEKHFSILYRHNPTLMVKETQIPIVTAALFEISPVTQLPLFIEIMQNAVGVSLEAAANYFSDYCKLVLQPTIGLSLLYGISLEGHQQNTIMVFENNRPAFMIARDMGGLQIYLPVLEKAGYHFNAYPESSIISHTPDQNTNTFIHSVLNCHLGEIILMLAKYFKVSETMFWEILRTNMETIFQQLKPRVDPVVWQREYDAIFTQKWLVKSLLHMRLKNTSADYINIALANPFSEQKP